MHSFLPARRGRMASLVAVALVAPLTGLGDRFRQHRAQELRPAQAPRLTSP